MTLPLRTGHPCLRDMLKFRAEARLDHGGSGDRALWRNGLQRDVMGNICMGLRYGNAPSYCPYAWPSGKTGDKPLRFAKVGRTLNNIG